MAMKNYLLFIFWLGSVCPNCGHEITAHQSGCIHCGTDKPEPEPMPEPEPDFIDDDGNEFYW